MSSFIIVNKGLIFDIRRFSVHDGPGIRTTVFFKGCPLTCWWCHNPEGRIPEPETSVRNTRMEERLFQRNEIAGRTMTPEEVLNKLCKDRVFYEESGGGVTFSGGEPLMQPEFLEELLKECRKKELRTAVDTCGFAGEKVIRKIAPLADLFLFDLKLLDDAEHIKYTGVSNRVILENFRILIDARRPVSVRFPVIPGITDTVKNSESLIRFLAPHSEKIGSLHLLPYHGAGKGKYARFGKKYPLEDIKSPDKAHLERMKEKFGELGVPVRIGG